MATVVNKATLQLIEFANRPDYSPTEWLINPVLPSGFVSYSQFHKVVNNTIVVKTESELMDYYKKIKLRQLADWYTRRLEDGFDIEGNNIFDSNSNEVTSVKLKATNLALAKWNATLTGFQLMGVDDTFETLIWDSSGNKFKVTIGVFKALIAGLAQALFTFETVIYVNYENQIAAATTKAELDSIMLGG